MPIYGYLCPACGDEFEALQRMTDEAVANCPRCGAPSRRLFFPTGIVFKGSGFYATDSRRGSAAVSPASAAKKAAAGSDGDRAAGARAGDRDAAGGASGGDTGSKAGSSAT